MYINNCDHGAIHSVISLVLLCNVLEQDTVNHSMDTGKSCATLLGQVTIMSTYCFDTDFASQMKVTKLILIEVYTASNKLISCHPL